MYCGRGTSITNMSAKKRNVSEHLGVRITLLVIMTAVILVFASVTAGYISYSAVKRTEVEEESRVLARTAKIFIEADKITYYLDAIISNEFARDGAYNEALDIMRQLVSLSTAVDLFVLRYIPDSQLGGGSLYYVMDAAEHSNHLPGDIVRDIDDNIIDAMRAGADVSTYVSEQSDSEHGVLLRIYEPVTNSSGRIVAYVGVVYPLAELKHARSVFLIVIITVSIAISIVMCLISLINIHHTVTIPLRLMVHAVNDFLISDTGQSVGAETAIAKLKIKTGDEIEMLANALKTLAARIAGYITVLSSESHEEYDPLTGLHTEPSFRYTVSSPIYDRAARIRGVGQDALFAIEIIDYDALIDEHGRIFSDKVLINMGKILRETFRSNGICGRTGENTFAVYWKNTGDSPNVIERRANQLLNAISVITHESSHDRIAAAIGIAIAPRDGAHYAELTDAAEKALESAKKLPEGGFVLYTPESDHTQH